MFEILFVLIIGIQASIVPPPWANSTINPCASQLGGWQMLYWPDDGKCYKIFKKGYPCSKSMELSPSITNGTMMAKCTCPPEYELSNIDKQCHKVFQVGPCNQLQTIECHSPEKCNKHNEIFWPKTHKCYPEYSKGPCLRGELFVRRLPNTLIGSCQCNETDKTLQKHYSKLTGKCFEHFTSGPCEDYGLLFLPNATCGCSPDLIQYHNETNACFQLGTKGPCNKGHIFKQVTNEQYARCQCKSNYIFWSKDRICYRQYTQGPCKKGEILINATHCKRNPCSWKSLYFPLHNKCYAIGSQGPCKHGKVITYDLTTEVSIDGISYNGVCSCPGPYNDDINCALDQTKNTKCNAKEYLWAAGKCYKIYSRGPCDYGMWFVPQRQGRNLHYSYQTSNKGRCECKPGFQKTIRNKSVKCLAPSVSLANYLNFAHWNKSNPNSFDK